RRRCAPPPALRDVADGNRFALARTLSALEKPGDSMLRTMLHSDNLGVTSPEQLAAQQRELEYALRAGGDSERVLRTSDSAHARCESHNDNTPQNEQYQRIPVLGVTGTGGAGKSSLVDELVLRFRIGQRERLKIAILAVDPSRRKTGGALLGDRIRMNAIAHPHIFMRSVAARGRTAAGGALPAALEPMINACKLADFDLVIVETPGIGQGDSGVADLVDCALYVMTPEYGAQSQLEKIDMLDFADFIAINKFDRAGAKDAYRDVCKQVQRNREAFDRAPEAMPVYGTISSQFNDDGVTALYQGLLRALAERGLARDDDDALAPVAQRCSSERNKLIPTRRARYLAEIAESVRGYKQHAAEQAELARERQQLEASRTMLRESAQARSSAADEGVALAQSPASEQSGALARSSPTNESATLTRSSATDEGGALAHSSSASESDALTHSSPTNEGDDALARLSDERARKMTARSRDLLAQWPSTRARYSGDELAMTIREREIRAELSVATLSGNRVRKIALPNYHDDGDLLNWLMLENLPGHFPFTAGVFPMKRDSEDPTRMFAGEGDAFRTNRRFQQLSAHAPAKRLSTAFDSVTLYGCDPDEHPDIYGKVGNSGVSIATLDDLKALYHGFDLCDPMTSVSMTINGPAPIILAMFLNAAMAQRVDAFREQHQREPDATQRAELEAAALREVRGTVQADILKEDQGQNTCIFSIEFSLKLMSDIQEYFIQRQVRNFYSVSISGYHIAEAGANPISQLAFTLANGFTYVESYLARGMQVDDFAANLSFFFSNGMDPEYTVMGRVARRIWAVAMRERYGAGERSQKLKYHIQTSGRSLHAQEMSFNDIRTTLQALIAIYDNCNSLHTNAFDEAVTTPTEESVRRALAIQLIINQEWGLAFNHNPNQGSFIIEQLTDLVEEAVLREFERISERGGVLGAMESGYQRGKIQDESMLYEHRKHDGSLPIVGVNTFLGTPSSEPGEIKLARSSDAEKKSQIKRLREFHARHAAQSAAALAQVKQAALDNHNVFAALVDAVQFCSLGQLTALLHQVGGQYRRNL
ncbi:MAG: methylmalonyl-CoA mutase family protein, partial [bacterium]